MHPTCGTFWPSAKSLLGLKPTLEKLLISWDSAIRLQGSNQTGEWKEKSGESPPLMAGSALAEGAREDGEGVCINICPPGGTGARNSPLILHSITLAGHRPRLFVTNGLGWI